MKDRRNLRSPKLGDRGFSMVELLIVVTIILIIVAIAVPNVAQMQRNYQLRGSAKGIAGQLALVKMRASADFTLAELAFNLTGGTYQPQVWNKSTSAFQVEAGTGQAPLPKGVTFDFGNISTPAGSQTTIAQSPQIVFNSRGIPIDLTTRNPKSDYAIYIAGAGAGYCAVTVSLSGQIKVWRYNASTSTWVAI